MPSGCQAKQLPWPCHQTTQIAWQRAIITLYLWHLSASASAVHMPERMHHHEEILLNRFQPKSVGHEDIVRIADAATYSNRRKLTSAIGAQDYVSQNGTYFQVNGKRRFFAGTNIFFLLLQQTPDNRLGFTDAGVKAYLGQQSTFGINLIRFWGAINGNGIVGGYGFTDTTDKSIMISIDPTSLQGTYNETGFRRFDLALDAASRAGTYSIIPLVNGAAAGNTTHPAIAGGMQWYVDQVLGDNAGYGSGGSYNLFYTDARVKQAYKNYIAMVLNRVNTYNGRVYKEDPAVFSWELANEAASTADQTGEIVAAWVAEIAGFIRSIDQVHMISTGEVGADIQPGVNSSQCLPCASPDPGGSNQTARAAVPSPFNLYHSFINAGDAGKGTSYSLNTAVPDISFGTLHVYPESMGVPFSALGGTDNYSWANEYFIKPRAAATAALGKPIIIEEFGQTPNYGNTTGLSNPRAVVYNSQVEAAISAGAAAIVAWEELPNIVEPTQYYDYTWNSDGGEVIGALASYAYCSNKGDCSSYEAPEGAGAPQAQGLLCDLGQAPRKGCAYCDLVYKYQGGPLNTCATDLEGGNYTVCQNDYNLLSCAGSCMCGLPAPPPAASAPGCGNNASLYSQQAYPGPGCSCCDAGFDYQDSCATQLSYNTSTSFKCNEPYVKPYCMCTCGFCPGSYSTPESGLTKGAKAGLGVGVGVAVLFTIIAFATALYLYAPRRPARDKKAPPPLPGPRDPDPNDPDPNWAVWKR